jgi:two-component system sensor histidine kinase/response regulator
MEPSIHGDLEISILYVEDEAAAREMVGNMLAGKIHGLRLFCAENGESGLAILREYQPDIVVTDIHMPVMDGVRMADAIKSLNPETLIVAVTAFSDSQNLLNAIEIGVNHYVLKPIDYGKLFAAIRKCIEIVRLQRQVKKQNERIEILNTNLAAYASELEMANQELEAFNYSVSHDLRRPLTTINGYCQVIQTLCGAKLDGECREYLKEIHDGTLRMNQLIKTLLDFSRINRYELRRQKVNLSGLAGEVAASLQRAEPARRATIRIAEGMTAYGDEDLLRLVLENLFGNAWKYAGRREEAVIESGVTGIDGTPAYFIHDNGAGFDMADAGRLFIPFQRLHATDDFAGHGIGLATVQRIIQRHGGRVWAEGEPGIGATFYFTLPAGETAPSPRSSSLFPETMSRRP